MRVSPKTFAVQPSDSRVVDVQLIALPNKSLTGELTFNSDDPKNPNFVMPWSASLVREAFLAVNRVEPEMGQVSVDTETYLQLTFEEPLFQRGRYLGLDVELYPRAESGPMMDEYEIRGDGSTVLFPVELTADTDYRMVIFSASSIDGANPIKH